MNKEMRELFVEKFGKAAQPSAALAQRLLAHAELHESHVQDDDQRQWAADLREAARLLATQPGAEPVAWLFESDHFTVVVMSQQEAIAMADSPDNCGATITPLYKHPSPADEAVRRDAERYRWLLQECYRWPPAGRVCGREDQAQPVAIWTTFEGDDVDAAIDAAIAAQQQEGRGRE